MCWLMYLSKCWESRIYLKKKKKKALNIQTLSSPAFLPRATLKWINHQVPIKFLELLVRVIEITLSEPTLEDLIL
jgi:hypothetical protein